MASTAGASAGRMARMGNVTGATGPSPKPANAVSWLLLTHGKPVRPCPDDCQRGNGPRPGARSSAGARVRRRSAGPRWLLAALIVIQTFTTGHRLTLDPRAAGLAAAAVAVLLRAPFLVVVAVAAATAALLRLVT